MNVVKIAGLVMIAVAGVSIYTGGSLFVTIPIGLLGIWVFLIGGLSG